VTNSALLSIIITAIGMVESGGDPKAVNGKCVGILQLEPIYVADANRLVGKAKWTGMDRYSAKQSRAMAAVVLGHYAKPEWTVKQVARLHKCGIRAMNKPETESEKDYCQRVYNIVQDMLNDMIEQEMEE